MPLNEMRKHKRTVLDITLMVNDGSPYQGGSG